MILIGHLSAAAAFTFTAPVKETTAETANRGAMVQQHTYWTPSGDTEGLKELLPPGEVVTEQTLLQLRHRYGIKPPQSVSILFDQRVLRVGEEIPQEDGTDHMIGVIRNMPAFEEGQTVYAPKIGTIKGWDETKQKWKVLPFAQSSEMKFVDEKDIHPCLDIVPHSASEIKAMAAEEKQRLQLTMKDEIPPSLPIRVPAEMLQIQRYNPEMAAGYTSQYNAKIAKQARASPWQP